MNCKNCGVIIEDGAAFCPNCGAAIQAEAPVYEQPAAPVAEPVAEPTAPVYEQPVAPAYEQPVAPAYEQPVEAPQLVMEDPGKKQGTTAMILGIIAAALTLVCGCSCGCLGLFIPIVLGVIGLIFGIKANKASKAAGFKNTQALVGIILSALTLGIGAIWVLIAVLSNGFMLLSDPDALGDMFEESFEIFEDILDY